MLLYVHGQNASCARAVVEHFAKLTVVVVFFTKTYYRYLVSFSSFVVVLINW